MNPYACSVVPIEDLAIFRKIEKILEAMPATNFLISCHLLSRALSRFFPLECKDGYFGGFARHSWLVTANGLIIDAYPVAVVGGPLLIDIRYLVPWRDFYKEQPLKIDNLERVEEVVELIGSTMIKLQLQ